MAEATRTAPLKGLPPLWLSSAAIAAGITVAFGVARWVDHYVNDPYEEDFRLNYVAAKIAFKYGWSHIYDRDLQQRLMNVFAPGQSIDTFHVYVTPPPLAMLAAPLTVFSVPIGFLIWTILSLAAVVTAWWLVCPGSGLGRLTLLLVPLALWPLNYAFWLAQTPAISILCLAFTWWLLERRRWAPAGAVFALAFFIKPQEVVLLPAALLVAGMWRPALSFALACAVLGIMCLALLGSHGLVAYIDTFKYNQTNLIHSVMTYAWFGGGPGPVARAIEITAGVVALAMAWYRRARPDLVFALGIVGTTASAFYLHEYDPAVFVVPAWILLRSRLSLPMQAWLVVGVVAAQLIAIAMYKPMLIWEAGWIALLGLEPWLVTKIRVESSPSPPLLQPHLNEGS